MKVVRNMDAVKSRGDEVVKQIIAEAQRVAELGHSTGLVHIKDINGLDIDYIIKSVNEVSENTVVVSKPTSSNYFHFNIID